MLSDRRPGPRGAQITPFGAEPDGRCENQFADQNGGYAQTRSWARSHRVMKGLSPPSYPIEPGRGQQPQIYAASTR